MSRIQLLSDDVINKIAAGEVVERPASIVKELVENAMDAGATAITIELEDGGKNRITISDNGTGIARDDLPMAITRHATSKIRSEEDLYNIASMGFRGEALASIAAVSNFAIRTQPEEGVGSWLEVKGGREMQVHEWSGPRGASVTVADLFFNVPARRSFLKSSQSEYAACLEYVHALALSHPTLAFTLLHNGKMQLNCQAASDGAWQTAVRQRAAEVIGADIADQLIYAEKATKYGQVRALVSPPGRSFAHSKNMFFFLNGRWVKDKTIRFGILRGFHSHLLRGKYPCALIDISCDPSLVDVNVHPSKTEVRFQFGHEVQSLIAIAVREAIRSGVWANPSTLETGATSSPSFQVESTFVAQTPEREVTFGFAAPRAASSSFSYQAPSSREPRWLSTRGEGTQEAIAAEFLSGVPRRNELPPHHMRVVWSELNFIGAFARCYLFFSQGDHLLVVDQHAYHERVLYERLKRDTKSLCHAQPLLVPELLDLRPTQADLLASAKDRLAGFGFRYDIAGDTALELKALPAILSRRDPQAIFDGLCLALSQHSAAALPEDALFHDLLSTMACHAAVRAGEELSQDDLKRLLAESADVDFYHNCPHGRPVFKWWKLSEVAGWFDR